VFHTDGQLAEGPIALCEVQAYVYLAKLRAAGLADILLHKAKAATLRAQAETLQKQFEQQFWLEDLGTYALALDGQKKPCRVRTSNAGHCLFAGIASPEHARRAARTLLKDTSYSGWGIRTLDAQEVRYNPMSYHNGSVWPHDNALIAAGFWRYGLREETLQVLSGLFELSRQVEWRRLPELICGFHRRPHEGPTIYPSACAPQAWAAGTPIFLLATILGLSIDAPQNQVTFTRPLLPPYLQDLSIQRLRVGDAALNVTVRGRRDDVDIQTTPAKGTVKILVHK
jgi:glycogen debranching enzyme